MSRIATEQIALQRRPHELLAARFAVALSEKTPDDLVRVEILDLCNLQAKDDLCGETSMSKSAASTEGAKIALESIPRGADGVPCSCGGYADLVESTKDEIANQSCGRSYKCCCRAFKCRICKSRLVGNAEAPEAG